MRASGRGGSLAAQAASDKSAPASAKLMRWEWGGGGGGGGRRLNVRIRLTSAQPRRPRRICGNPGAPTASGCRVRGAGPCLALRPGTSVCVVGSPQSTHRGWVRAFACTCDGPRPAVELHGVVERSGHRVQDAAGLRVHQPHRGAKRCKPRREERPLGTVDGCGGDPADRGVSSSSRRRGWGCGRRAAVSSGDKKPEGGGGGGPAASAQRCSSLSRRAAAAPIPSPASRGRAGRGSASSRPGRGDAAVASGGRSAQAHQGLPPSHLPGN